MVCDGAEPLHELQEVLGKKKQSFCFKFTPIWIADIVKMCISLNIRDLFTISKLCRHVLANIPLIILVEADTVF